MHTLVVMFGVVVNIILITAVLSIVVGMVWVISPLKDKEVYMGSVFVYTPLGGRITGLIILGSGVAGLVLGFLLDRVQFKLVQRYGART